MNITVIGTGYVGLVTGACLASLGFKVLCCDSDEQKIKKIITGIIPVYEPGLDELIKNYNANIIFTTDIKAAVEHSEIIFITVNTPTLDDNTCDLSHVFDVAEKIALHMTGYKVIVNKSTVPVGTGGRVKNAVKNTLDSLNKQLDFDVVSNPEFLKEGSAINDFMYPDRIVIGADSSKAAELIKQVYSDPVFSGVPILSASIETAEMIKYASNAFLASKISFINEMANICELCGADIKGVELGMGLDTRIGMKYLRPGPGFGGSCFPKDIRALAGIAEQYGYTPLIVNSVIEANKNQIHRMVKKIENTAGPLENNVVTILGLAFKPDTDDTRESPAVLIIKELLDNKAVINVYDPKAMNNAKQLWQELDIRYFPDMYSACAGSSCIVLCTEWKEFSHLDFNKLRSIVSKPVFIDLRNVFDPVYVESFGFYYEGVGRFVNNRKTNTIMTAL